MIHLIYGKDDYRVRAALAEVRTALDADDGMLESNTTRLDGQSLTPEELLAHVTAVPFLAPHRLVIVEGLLQVLGGAGGRRRKKAVDAEDPLAPWREVANKISDPAEMPASTVLVFLEGDLPKNNAAFPIFAPIARSIEYKPLDPQELRSWISSRAREGKLKVGNDVVARLAEMVGPDLWAITNEMEKLDAYAGGEPIDPGMLSQLVTESHETKFWDLTDAILAGNDRAALTALRRLFGEGEAPQLLLFMIVAQFRRIAVVKDLVDRRAPKPEIALVVDPQKKRDTMVDRAVSRAGRYSWEQVGQIYQRLLEADLSVKRGLQDDESALQLLVHELCAMAPRSVQRPSVR